VAEVMQGSIREILWHERFICKFLCGIIMNVVAGRGKSLSQTYGDGETCMVEMVIIHDC
jgi:hypothetical protein